MPKYLIRETCTSWRDVEVEADTEEDAIDLVADDYGQEIANGERDNYDWIVLKVDA